MALRKLVLLAALVYPTLIASAPYDDPVPLSEPIPDCPKKTGSCPKAQVFCIRGTTEAPGCGELGKLVSEVLDDIPGSDCQALDYPADGINLTTKVWNIYKYGKSEGQGVINMIEDIMEFDERCPDTPFALLGYSQGGHVVGDVLCGRTSAGFSETVPIPPHLVRNMAAVLQLGDPSNRRNEFIPWHKGNGSKELGGIFPRPLSGFQPCLQYADKWQSWCDVDSRGVGDFFCGSIPGLGSIPIHAQYIRNHKEELREWVVGQLNDAIQSRSAGSAMEL